MANRLAHETSPYLQQHADNPVHWQPWDDAALAMARDSGRPILLSIGYSACHWCHVMAHECFEDARIAALMNRDFVNIKVDREERPDLDQVYQAAHQLVTGRAGGWPLTMFLAPDGKPFFGGTYFPPQPRHGLPGFDQVLQRVAQAWGEQRAALQADGQALADAIGQMLGAQPPDAGAPALALVAEQAPQALRTALMPAFDAVEGGFGGAPKFPQPALLGALLRQGIVAHDAAARDAVLLTLRRMAEGGSYDQLGGGFFRYSTDAKWRIPHFEKMLYDNGPLLHLYAQAWQLTREPLFARVCEETAGWLMREMQSDEGGFFSSIDADSEGEEGRFYVWTPQEVRALLAPPVYAAFAARYGLDGPANFEGRAWHLHVARPIDDVAAACGLDAQHCQAMLDGARRQLLAQREARVRPHRDEKILASWNALAVEGLMAAARVFERPAWAASARRALEFVRARLWHDGRLLATYKDGRAHLNAYLDDHAFALAAMMQRLQDGVLDPSDLAFARALADGLLARFEDAPHGGFFFTSHDHEALVVRPKPAQDGALPSGNGVAALQLQRLGHLLGEPRYLQAAQRTMAVFAPSVQAAPQGFPSLVEAMAEHHAPPPQVLLAGAAEAIAAWQHALALQPVPGLLALHLPADGSRLPESLRRPAAGVPQAWVCRGTQCLAPIGALQPLLQALVPP